MASNVALSIGTSAITVILSDRNSGTRELALGTSYGPLQVQLASSNSQVVRVPAAPIQFAPGDSRKSAVLELVGRGDAVVSLIAPASFTGSSPARQDVVVSVK